MLGNFSRRVIVVLGLIAAVAMRGPAEAETLIGTDVESRVIVGLSADADAIQSMLPDGWTPIAFPRGPLKGANLLVSFIDGHIALDADGKPLSPGSRRAVSLVSLAKEDGGDGIRLYLTGVYAAAEEGDPYGLKTAADISRRHTLSGAAEGGRRVEEIWSVAPESGGSIELALEFTTGRRSWGLSGSTVFSAGNPDFRAIYRWDSLTDVVMSDAMEKPLSGSLSLTSSLPELAEIFDGNEEVRAILDVPVRVRRTYSP